MAEAAKRATSDWLAAPKSRKQYELALKRFKLAKIKMFEESVTKAEC